MSWPHWNTQEIYPWLHWKQEFTGREKECSPPVLFWFFCIQGCVNKDRDPLKAWGVPVPIRDTQVSETGPSLSHEGKNTSVEFSVPRHELAQSYSPSQMEVLLLSAGLISSGLVPQELQCHSSCSRAHCGLMWEEPGPGKDPGDRTVHRNQQFRVLLLLWMCFCCVSSSSLCLRLQPLHPFQSLSFLYFPLPPLFRFAEVAELRTYHTTPTAFLAHPVYPEPVCACGCELLRLCRCLPAQWWHCSAHPSTGPC